MIIAEFSADADRNCCVETKPLHQAEEAELVPEAFSAKPETSSRESDMTDLKVVLRVPLLTSDQK